MKPAWRNTILLGDVRATLRTLPEKIFHAVITSPPYWALRSYLPKDHADKPLEIGSERTLAEYVATMVDVFGEVRRVMRDDGVLFLNLGDSYGNDSKWGGQTGGKHVKHLHGKSDIGLQEHSQRDLLREIQQFSRDAHQRQDDWKNRN